MNSVIGKCGNCGGEVTVPQVWYGIYPPHPTCNRCGSKAARPNLPTIPMEPKTVSTGRPKPWVAK